MMRNVYCRLSSRPRHGDGGLAFRLWRRWACGEQWWWLERRESVEMTAEYEAMRWARGARQRMEFSDTEAILQVCSIIRRWGWGSSAISHLDSLPFHPTPFHLSEAIKSLRDLPTIIGLFRWARSKRWYSPSSVVFTSLIDRFGSTGDFDTMEWLVQAMKDDRCDLVSATYQTLIRCYSRASKLEQASEYLAQATQHSFQIDVHCLNLLIESFCRAELPQKALETFEQIEACGCAPDERTYKLLMPALAKAGNLDQACRLYYDMTTKGLHPDLPSYYSLISGLAKAGRFNAMMQLYGDMKKAGIPPSLPIYATIIESFARAGMIDMAMTVLTDSQDAGYKPFASTYTMLIEAHIKAMQLDGAAWLHDSMVQSGCMPNFTLVSDLISSFTNAKQLAKAVQLFNGMIAGGLLPNPKVCSALVEGHVDGDFEAAVKLYQSIRRTYELFLNQAKENNSTNRALKTSQEMAEFKFSVDSTTNNYLMKLSQGNGVKVLGNCFNLMVQAGLQPYPKICNHLMENYLKLGLYEMSKQALDQFLKSGCSPNLHTYCLILSSLTRCSIKREDGFLVSITKQDKILMSMLSSTGHQAHKFLCSLWSGPQQRKEAPLDLVRSFFQRLDAEVDVRLARWFTSVLLNYLVLVGQIKRARCVWKVAYERKIFPGRILFDRDAVWSVDVRTLSIGTALTAVVHTLHRFRKRIMDYDSIPRRIKIITGFNLRAPVVDMLSPLGSPFETSGGCLRSRGIYVADWFKQPFIEKFLENELPSSDEILLQRLKMTFPQPAQEPYMLIMNAGMAR